LPEAVIRKATEILGKLQPMLGDRRLATVTAIALGLALEEIYPSMWNDYSACKSLNVSEISVRSLINKIKESKLL